MTTPPLIIVKGLFLQNSENELLVQEASGEVFRLGGVLESKIGEELTLNVHYILPETPLIRVPGFGSCTLPFCEIHAKNPEHLFNFSGEGVLTSPSKGNFLLGGKAVPIREQMVGHYGMVVLLQKPKASNMFAELAEISKMTEILQDLKRELS